MRFNRTPLARRISVLAAIRLSALEWVTWSWSRKKLPTFDVTGIMGAGIDRADRAGPPRTLIEPATNETERRRRGIRL